ncbi:MAG: hypothetical protein KQH53_00150 [Desulfarculaceae bacterium]|nr:hypothetical protein [Desulfarculaceae bacterium]
MEIVAVYREHPIRTYGVRPRGGLALVGLDCPAASLEALAAELAEAPASLGVELCAAPGGEPGAAWRVCLPLEQAPALAELTQRAGGRCGPAQEVSLIALQGPHFGDRWGIASQALTALEEAGVEPCLLLGVTHTLQLVVPASEAERALAGLGRHFSSPEAGNA